MSKHQVQHILLTGSSYEVGRELAEIFSSVDGCRDSFQINDYCLSGQEEQEMLKMFDEYCPGINDEIKGLADGLGIHPRRVLYYAMTYLRPGCSQVAVLPQKTDNGHTLLARNYDFSDSVDEMTLCTTKVAGKYMHLGTSVVRLGRSDGMNEKGLAVSQSSAGLPVGNFEFARKPVIAGLQFWAVLRSVLENCRDVDEAIAWSLKMPIAYNINMLVADKTGAAALIETFNGEKAVRRIGKGDAKGYICSTNHVHLPELMAKDPFSMKNSLHRYRLICDTLDEKDNVSLEDLKELFSAKYPEGLGCQYYDDFFGTLHSLVFDVNTCTTEIRWGSPGLNEWSTITLNDTIQMSETIAYISRERAPEGFYSMLPEH